MTMRPTIAMLIPAYNAASLSAASVRVSDPAEGAFQ